MSHQPPLLENTCIIFTALLHYYFGWEDWALYLTLSMHAQEGYCQSVNQSVSQSFYHTTNLEVGSL